MAIGMKNIETTARKKLEELAKAQRDLIWQEEMKKRTCKNCKYFGPCMTDGIVGKCENESVIVCVEYEDMFFPPETFGCNQWEQNE